jgi:hypothetical protein
VSRRTRLAAKLRNRPQRRNRADRCLSRQIRDGLRGVPPDLVAAVVGQDTPWAFPDADPLAGIAAIAERHPWAGG